MTRGPEKSTPTVVVGDTSTSASNLASLAAPGVEARYEAGPVLGRGGMGEVRVFRDVRIGREVAWKTLRSRSASPSSRAFARFLREARVQGQLEHPAVLPVYDLSLDADGQAFFTMKRVRGRTLASILEARRRGEDLEAFNLRRLLTAFVQVCLALDFAHHRGVLHRDIKPANIMLGEYGEVHILDWGLAKIVGSMGDDGPEGSTVRDTDAPQPTLAGSILGTPGYLSPEQARGETDALDARTDVYALGAVLYEIVHGSPLHEGDTTTDLIVSTLRGGVIPRPGHGEDVAPELDAICSSACELDVDYRTRSARAIAEAVESFLDGERDEERRKALAAKHVARALALESEGSAKRGEALRELGRALVLDPSHEGALQRLEGILTGTPDTSSPEAEAEIRAFEASQLAEVLRRANLRTLLWIGVGTVAFAGPMVNFPLACFVLASLLLLLAIGVWVEQRHASSRAHWRLVVISTAVVTALLATVFSPFLVVPTLAATNSVLFAPQTRRHDRRLLHTSLAVATGVPSLLSFFGWIPPLFSLEGGSLVLHSHVFHWSGPWVLPGLIALHALLVVFSGSMSGRFFDRLRVAEAHAIAQAVYLRSLLPRRSRG